MLYVKYGKNRLHGFRGEVVWKCWLTHDGCLSILSAHLRAFGSGELKMKDFFKSYSGNLLIIPNKLTKVQAPTCSSIKTIYAPPQNAQKRGKDHKNLITSFSSSNAIYMRVCQNPPVGSLDWLVFVNGSSTLLRSFRAWSVNLSTLILGRLP